MARRQQDKVRTLRAVNANPGIRAVYRRALRSMVRAMKEDYEHRLSELYSVLEPRIVGDAKWRSPLERMQEALDKLSDRWTAKFSSLADKVAPRIVKDVLSRTVKARNSSLRDAGISIPLKDKDLEGRLADERVQVLVEANVALIKTIPAKLHGDVQQMVTDAMTFGWPHEKLTEKIAKTFGISERRAGVIARDQTLKATQSLAQALDRELGITEGVWIHVPGKKSSRPTHVAMDGKKFTLSTGLWDSAVNRWVKPGELICCYCKYRAVVPESLMLHRVAQPVFE